MGSIRVIPAWDDANVQAKLATLVLARVMEEPDVTLSLFAGTPAFGFYKTLVDRAKAESVDFSRTRFVVVDELLSEAREAPFRRVLEDRIFAPLSIPAENVISFDPEADPQRETARIRELLALRGIGLALLSVDSRGHLGFHGEGADLESGTGIVSIRNPERWHTDRAFSLGLRDIARADRIILFASGKNLAEVVRRLTEGAFAGSTPISILQKHPQVTLVADRGALSGVVRTDRITGFHAGYFILDADTAPQGRRILVVSPHPDDAPISLGGTMAILAPHNRMVTAVMGTGHRAFIYGTEREERIAIREGESGRESRILGVEPRFLRLSFYDRNYEIHPEDIEAFRALLCELTPDWIFLPHAGDQHPAHVASRNIALEAVKQHLRKAGGTIEAWEYEGPWAMFSKGEFNTIVSVSPPYFMKKTQAIRVHESQVARTPYDVAADSLARLRSSLVPEAELAGFGAKPPKLEPYLELFHRDTLRP